MNTIDYIANGQNVQFSKKSVTIDGKEFAYTEMSAIKHSSAKHIYLFKYDGAWQKLCYNAEDEKKLAVLFSRIADLNAKRAAKKAAEKAKAPAEATPAETPAEPVINPVASELFPSEEKIDVKSILNLGGDSQEEPAIVEPVVEPEDEPIAVEPEEAEPITAETEPITAETEPAIAEVSEGVPSAEADVEEPAVVVEGEEPVEIAEEEPALVVEEEEPVVVIGGEEPAAVTGEEELVLEPAPETVESEEPILTGEAPAAETDGEALTVEEPAAEATSDSEEKYSVEDAVSGVVAETETAEKTEIFPPEEKKAKLKKGFIIFAAVIALFVILGVVYFFVAGTSNNPTVGPNADETQQYDDIDGLIEDLQEE